MQKKSRLWWACLSELSGDRLGHTEQVVGQVAGEKKDSSCFRSLVIFVMIVILKVFTTKNRIIYDGKNPGL